MYKTFETVLLEQCAPTLAGIKPANLFSYHSEDLDAAVLEAELWNERLCRLGITVRILKKCCKTMALVVYVYRQSAVEKILSDAAAAEFLGSVGYDAQAGIGQTLALLSRRICTLREFPHEIGVFLGYPLEDVIGFIENKGMNFTCCGCWKAYTDPEKARTRFDGYRRCTVEYKEKYRQGFSIIQLTVAA